MNLVNDHHEDNRFGAWQVRTHDGGVETSSTARHPRSSIKELAMFVIAGVSGNTGSVVANTLLEAKKPVRVIVRDAAKGEPWKAKGAEVAIASVEDRAAFARALAGAEGAYLLLPPNGFGDTDLAAKRKAL